jgi:5-oxoprolinase (ATP-hydrolysing)
MGFSLYTIDINLIRKYKGGDGIVREYKFKEKLNVSILSERRVFEPNGIEGGQNGLRGINIYTYADGR